jgi:hypothetical protein
MVSPKRILDEIEIRFQIQLTPKDDGSSTPEGKAFSGVGIRLVLSASWRLVTYSGNPLLALRLLA